MSSNNSPPLVGFASDGPAATANTAAVTSRPQSRRFLPRLPSTANRSKPTPEAIAEFDRLKAEATAAAAGDAVQAEHKHVSATRAQFSFFGNDFSTTGRRVPRLPSAQYQPVSAEQHEQFAREQEAALKQRQHRFMPRLPSSPRRTPVDKHAIEEFDRQREAALQPNNRSSMQLFPTKLAGQFSHSMAHLPSAKTLAPHIHTKEEEQEVLEIEKNQPQAPTPKFKTVRERVVYEIKFRHACERALMACFAVCLLWLTSLAVAQSIVYNLIVGPSLESVMYNLDRAMNATDLQRNAYEACANRSAQDCEYQFNLELNNEVNRVDGILAANRIKLDSYNVIRAECADNFATVMLLLDHLTTVMGEALDPKYSTPNFTEPICAAVVQTLEDQIRAIRAHETAEQFVAEVDAKLDSFYAQYRARVAYDKSYTYNSTVGFALGGDDMNRLVADPRGFFNNMSSPKDYMYACMREDGKYGTAQCSGTPLLKSLADGKTQFVSQFNMLTAQATGYFQEVENKYRPLHNFYTAFGNVLRDLAGIRAQLEGAAADNNGGSLNNMGYSDSTPSLPARPQFMSASQFSDVIGGSNLQALADRAMGRQQQADGTTAEQMNQDEAELKAKQTGWQATFFSDYNPPPYDPDEEQSSWREVSSSFLPDLSASLKVVATRINAPEESQDYESVTDTSSSGRLAKDLLKTPEVTPLSFFAYDNISPDLMLADWNYMTDLALYMDYTYRILHSISIIRSYWRISSVLVPPADVRVGSYPKGQTAKQRLTPDQLLATIATHPAVLLLLALLFVAIIASSFLAIYLPLFDQYVFGCVAGNAYGMGHLGQGTMITRNGYVVAVEYASGPGDSILSSSIDQVNVQRELMCSKNEDWSYQQQRVDHKEFDFHVDKFRALVDNVKTFQQCVNMTAVDLQFDAATILVVTNGTKTGTASLYDESCSSSFEQLDPDLFHCNNIASCAATCNGTTGSQYQSRIYNAGCNLEYYGHAGVLGTAFSALAFVLMNLSRCTVLRGLRRVFMQYFAQGEYSYLGTTSEVGEIEFPDEVKQGKSFQEFVALELHETIKAFERVGYVIVVFGLALNIPWVAGLISFSNNLRFTELTSGGN